jgi:microcystin-dependent protein
MSEPYIGEIRIFAGNFAPVGWAFCDGQLMPIAENDALFNLIGTTYGGDGQETFALPDLQGRLPLHQGSGFIIGQRAGVETVTLNGNQIPAHSHPLLATNDPAASASPSGNLLASLPAAGTQSAYGSTTPPGTIHASSVDLTGGNQPHDNVQPYLCLSFILSLFGVFPSQS